MPDNQKETWNVYRSDSLGGREPHEIVEGIHAGWAGFADLQMHFQDWQSAAKFYADITSQRFQIDAEAMTCELCGKEEGTRPYQFLFRAFLDRQWGKKVVKGLLMIPFLLFTLISPVIILPLSSRRSGLRLILPTFHNACRHCESALRFRNFLASFFGGFLMIINFILLVAAILGVAGVIIWLIVLLVVEDEKLSWTSLVLFFLISLAPLAALLLSSSFGAKAEHWLRFPEQLRHIAAGPFKYIPIKDGQITNPTILCD